MFDLNLEPEFESKEDLGGNVSSLGGYYNELKYFVEGLQGKNDLSVATESHRIRAFSETNWRVRRISCQMIRLRFEEQDH